MRLPKQTHKNANSDSRQTNHLQNRYNLLNKAGICILSNSIFVHREKGYTFSKKKIIPTLQYSISLANLLYRISIKKAIENKKISKIRIFVTFDKKDLSFTFKSSGLFLIAQ